ncbi:MAG: MucR family transcriptional regulator [Hyphomicrobiales bacterium]
MQNDTHLKSETLELTADIVAAFVSNNSISAADLPALIASVHSALSNIHAPVVSETSPLTPAVSVKKSITDDYLICLEDGKRFKSLKRHLKASYGMSPDEYRVKWGLPADYPMVAPNYSVSRSNLAKSLGLGQQRRKSLRR